MSTGLAAVQAAAEAVSRAEHEAALARVRTEAHAAGVAEGTTAGRTAGLAEGATAERARILGIEANALPGHEKLIAEMKADPAVTSDMAAGRILAAERKLRGDAAQAIADVENVTGAVKPAASGGATPPGKEKATTPEGWKAEYAKSADLQAEFGGEDAYVAYQAGLAGGNVRLLSRKSA